MKKLVFSTVMLAASYSFAFAEPTQPIAIEGTWNVTSRACTSNAPVKDGVKIGTDTISITQNKDMTFELNSNVGGCETVTKGTYKVDGMKIDYTAKTSQGCKDKAPVPVNEKQSMFVAFINGNEAVTVSTGDMAAEACPAGDALVTHWTKESATPPPVCPTPSPSPGPGPSPSPSPTPGPSPTP